MKLKPSEPPPKKTRRQILKRLRHLKMEYPDRDYFSAVELDPDLYGWMLRQERWLKIKLWAWRLGIALEIGAFVWIGWGLYRR